MPPISSNPVIIPDRDLAQDKSLDPSGPRIRCPLCGWSPRKASGLAPAAMSGTRSRREASAQPACTSGLKPSAFLAADVRRTPIGTRKNSNSPGWILQRGEALPATGVGGLWGLLEPKITVVPGVLSLVLCPTPHKGSDRRRPFLGL